MSSAPRPVLPARKSGLHFERRGPVRGLLTHPLPPQVQVKEAAHAVAEQQQRR